MSVTTEALCDANHSASEVTDQSRTSGCLVTSGRCWPSAADEEWHSPKRPSSTVTVNSSGLNTKLSAFSPVYCIYSLPLCMPPATPPSVVPDADAATSLTPQTPATPSTSGKDKGTAACYAVHTIALSVFKYLSFAYRHSCSSQSQTGREMARVWYLLACRLPNY